MLTHVLVPLDGSPLAEEALEPAKRVVGPAGKITLLTVIDVPELTVYGFYPTPTSTEKIDHLLTQARAYLNQIAADLREHGLQVRIEAQVGSPASAIVETAAKWQADAIVMSTHGHSGLTRWLFGSITNKVLNMTPCPVLVVPSRQRERGTEAPAMEAHHG